MRKVRLLIDERSGASAAEFALILPLLLILLLGMIDTGRYMWEHNRAEKATQMGVRYAVATDVVPSGLNTYSFAISGGIPNGDPVPVANFGSATCDDASCTCVASAGNFCGSVGYDGAAFQRIVDWMANHYPQIEADNVEIEYRNVGLGFSGNPSGSDVAALVTVRLNGLEFQPVTGMIFGVSVPMPDFRAALTLEDGQGSVSN